MLKKVRRNQAQTIRVFRETHGYGPWQCPECPDLVRGLGRGRGMVHHIDHDGTNDIGSNLVAMHEGCHVRHHHAGKVGNRLGAVVTPEVRARISASLKGRPAAHGYTPEIIEKMAAARRGKPHIEPRHTCSCGLVTTAGPLARHIKATGHTKLETQSVIDA